MERDLWPEDLVAGSISVPLVLLREQAALLGKKTQNLVEGQVSTGIRDPRRPPFVYDFFLVAPTLDDYKYRLFTLMHGPEVYPARIDVDDDISREFRMRDVDDGGHVIIRSESELIDFLWTTFNAEKTRRIISILLAQTAAQSSENPVT